LLAEIANSDIFLDATNVSFNSSSSNAPNVQNEGYSKDQ